MKNMEAAALSAVLSFWDSYPDPGVLEFISPLLLEESSLMGLGSSPFVHSREGILKVLAEQLSRSKGISVDFSSGQWETMDAGDGVCIVLGWVEFLFANRQSVRRVSFSFHFCQREDALRLHHLQFSPAGGNMGVLDALDPDQVARLAMDASTDLLFIIRPDSGCVCCDPDKLLNIYQIDPALSKLWQLYRLALSCACKPDRQPLRQHFRKLCTLPQDNQLHGEFRFCLPNGRTYWMQDIAIPISPGLPSSPWLLHIRDISRHKERELYFQEKSEQDSLTQVFNLRGIRRAVNRGLYSSGETGVFIEFDIDNFKLVNDSKGHLKGDEVLVEFTRILQFAAQDCGCVGRIGGDEFILFLPHDPGREQLTATLHDILRQFADYLLLEHITDRVSCSAGLVQAPGGGNSYDLLFRRADEALYRAKRSGKHNFSF